MIIVPAIRISAVDSCVTVTAPTTKGDVIRYLEEGGVAIQILANEDIPIYHKAAITEIPRDGFVYKYGEKIGIATRDIHVGDHIHIHNLRPVGFSEEACDAILGV
jgi:altronate dehydratase small subunit